MGENYNIKTWPEGESYLDDKMDLFLSTAKDFKTPFYLLDESHLIDRCNDFLTAFNKIYSNTKIFYSYKANTLPYMVKTIHNQGLGAEVTSLIELKLADKLGIKNIVFSSPSKTDEELKLALETSSVIIIDNLKEIDMIKKINDKLNCEPLLGIRLNPSLLDVKGWSRFGINHKDLEKVKEKFKEYDFKLKGLHFHLRGDSRNPRLYQKAIINMGNLLKKGFFEGFTDDISFIDVGGGIGVNGRVAKGFLEKQMKIMGDYTPINLKPKKNHNFSHTASLENFAEAICNTFKKEIKEILGDVELWVEPGRSISCQSVHLITKVINIKQNNVFLDGGLNLLFNSLDEIYPVVNLSKPSHSKTKANLFGPLCLKSDKISNYVFGEKPTDGDVLCILNVGSYNMNWALQFIKPVAGVVALSKNKSFKIRNEEDFTYRFSRDLLFHE